MIQNNPEADRWREKYFSLIESSNHIICLLARKAAQPPTKEATGTFACPYCYLEIPHSSATHDVVADDLAAAVNGGMVLTEKERDVLRVIERQCREHGEKNELAQVAAIRLSNAGQ